MIFCSVLHSLDKFDAPKYVFEQSALMADLRTQGSVSLEAIAGEGKKRQSRQMTLSWRAPDQLSGSFTADGESTQFFVDKFKSVAYRSDLKQYIQNAKDEKVNLRQAALIAEPKLDPLALAMLEVGQTAKFYEVFAKLPGWKAVVKGDLIHLTTRVSKIDYKAHFRSSDFGLALLSMKEGDVLQEWKLKPGSGLKSFQPKDADSKVVVFQEPLREPKYANAAVKATVAKMFKAYDRPDWLAFEIKDAGHSTKVLLKGEQLRQTDGETDFTYDGTKATVLDKDSKTVYEGPAKSREMQEAVVASGSRLDPIVRDLVYATNPFRRILSEKGTVVKVSMKMKDRSGQPVTLVEAKSPLGTMNIAIRDADGKVLSIMSELQGATENVGTQRVFEYLPKSAVDSASAFTVPVPSGAKRRAVSDIVARR